MATTTDEKKLTGTSATSQAYLNAMANLDQKLATTPTYDNQYDTQLNDVYNKIVNRESFQYNAGEDAMYQQYVDRYMQQGKTAMKDTMGQAAALTGGYGSTYAQNAGQQAYDTYLQGLNDKLLELGQFAYQRYQDEGDALQNQYSMLADQRDTAYDRYRDAVSDYNYNLNLAGNYEQQEYERNQYADELAYNRALQEEETAYSRSQDAYSKLYSLIGSTGYSPSDDELSAAGMSRAAADALVSAYQASQTTSTSSGGSGGGSSKISTEGESDTFDAEELQSTLKNLRNSGATSSEISEYATEYAKSRKSTTNASKSAQEKYASMLASVVKYGMN